MSSQSGLDFAFNAALVKALEEDVALTFKYETNGLKVLSRYLDYCQSSAGIHPVGMLILICKFVFNVPTKSLGKVIDYIVHDFRIAFGKVFDLGRMDFTKAEHGIALDLIRGNKEKLGRLNRTRHWSHDRHVRLGRPRCQSNRQLQ